MPVLAPELLAKFREVITAKYRGVPEAEAVAYARGFTRGLLAGGASAEQCKVVSAAAALKDPLLEAGAAFITQSMLEAAAGKPQG
jgi:hypothetical protein